MILFAHILCPLLGHHEQDHPSGSQWITGFYESRSSAVSSSWLLQKKKRQLLKRSPALLQEASNKSRTDHISWKHDSKTTAMSPCWVSLTETFLSGPSALFCLSKHVPDSRETGRGCRQGKGKGEVKRWDTSPRRSGTRGIVLSCDAINWLLGSYLRQGESPHKFFRFVLFNIWHCRCKQTWWGETQ